MVESKEEWISMETEDAEEEEEENEEVGSVVNGQKRKRSANEDEQDDVDPKTPGIFARVKNAIGWLFSPSPVNKSQRKKQSVAQERTFDKQKHGQEQHHDKFEEIIKEKAKEGITEEEFKRVEELLRSSVIRPRSTQDTRFPATIEMTPVQQVKKRKIDSENKHEVAATPFAPPSAFATASYLRSSENIAATSAFNLLTPLARPQPKLPEAVPPTPTDVVRSFLQRKPVTSSTAPIASPMFQVPSRYVDVNRATSGMRVRRASFQDSSRLPTPATQKRSRVNEEEITEDLTSSRNNTPKKRVIGNSDDRRSVPGSVDTSPQVVASHTALKILEALNEMSSPIVEAHKSRPPALVVKPPQVKYVSQKASQRVPSTPGAPSHIPPIKPPRVVSVSVETPATVRRRKRFSEENKVERSTAGSESDSTFSKKSQQEQEISAEKEKENSPKSVYDEPKFSAPFASKQNTDSVSKKDTEQDKVLSPKGFFTVSPSVAAHSEKEESKPITPEKSVKPTTPQPIPASSGQSKITIPTKEEPSSPNFASKEFFGFNADSTSDSSLKAPLPSSSFSLSSSLSSSSSSAAAAAAAASSSLGSLGSGSTAGFGFGFGTSVKEDIDSSTKQSTKPLFGSDLDSSKSSESKSSGISFGFGSSVSDSSSKPATSSTSFGFGTTISNFDISSDSTSNFSTSGKNGSASISGATISGNINGNESAGITETKPAAFTFGVSSEKPADTTTKSDESNTPTFSFGASPAESSGKGLDFSSKDFGHSKPSISFGFGTTTAEVSSESSVKEDKQPSQDTKPEAPIFQFSAVPTTSVEKQDTTKESTALSSFSSFTSSNTPLFSASTNKTTDSIPDLKPSSSLFGGNSSSFASPDTNTPSSSTSRFNFSSSITATPSTATESSIQKKDSATFPSVASAGFNFAPPSSTTTSAAPAVETAPKPNTGFDFGASSGSTAAPIFSAAPSSTSTSGFSFSAAAPSDTIITPSIRSANTETSNPFSSLSSSSSGLGSTAPSSGGFNFSAPSSAASSAFNFASEPPSKGFQFSAPSSAAPATPSTPNKFDFSSSSGFNFSEAPAPSSFSFSAAAPAATIAPAASSSTGAFNFSAAPSSSGFNFSSPSPAGGMSSSTGFNFSPAPSSAPSSSNIFSSPTPAFTAPTSSGNTGFNFGGNLSGGNSEIMMDEDNNSGNNSGSNSMSMSMFSSPSNTPFTASGMGLPPMGPPSGTNVVLRARRRKR